MRAGWLLAAALLPPAAFAATEDDLAFVPHVLNYVQIAPREFVVQEHIAVANPTNETFDGAVHEWLPASASEVRWQFLAFDDPNRTVPAGEYRTDGDEVRVEGEHRLVGFALPGGIGPNAGGRLLVLYGLEGDAVTKRFRHDSGGVSFSLSVLEGWEPRSDELAFARVADRFYQSRGGFPEEVEEGEEISFRLEETRTGAATPSLADRWGWVVVGAAAGAFLLGALVKGGVVPLAPRSLFAPRDALAEAPREQLEARKRVLMAALKELEVAHRGGEISGAVHAPLKAEFVEEAARVARELERREASGGAGH